MPTVLRIGPYRFFFYSNETNEPPHIHVQRDGAVAKFWIEPVALSRARNFSAQEINVIRTHVELNLQIIREAWNDYFGS